MTLRDHASEINDLRFVQGKTLREIAQIFGVSKQRIGQIIGNTGFVAAEKNKEFIQSNPELTNKEISSLLNLSRSAISNYRAKKRHAIENKGTAGKGAKWEEWTAQLLKQKGYYPELLNYGAPYDILLNGKIRIDVKSTDREWWLPGAKNPIMKFNVGKNKRQKCDFYFCVIINSLNYFIIPSIKVPDQMAQLQFSWPTGRCLQSNWQQYHKRWDLIDEWLKSEQSMEA